MTYEEFLNFVPSKCMYETIYDDSDGRTILVIKLLDAFSMVNKAQPKQEPVPTLEDIEQEIYQNTRNFVSRDVMEWMLRRYYTHPPQRTWVGLTDDEIDQGLLRTNYSMKTAGAWRDGVEWAQSQLKDKNT
jgi:hypothetical protein